MSTQPTQEQGAAETPETALKTSKRARKGRRALRHVMQFCFSSAVLVVVLGLGVAMSIGANLRAPDWVQARIAARIDASVPGYALRFGEMSLGWARIWYRGWRCGMWCWPISMV